MRTLNPEPPAELLKILYGSEHPRHGDIRIGCAVDIDGFERVADQPGIHGALREIDIDAIPIAVAGGLGGIVSAHGVCLL